MTFKDELKSIKREPVIELEEFAKELYQSLLWGTIEDIKKSLRGSVKNREPNVPLAGTTLTGYYHFLLNGCYATQKTREIGLSLKSGIKAWQCQEKEYSYYRVVRKYYDCPECIYLELKPGYTLKQDFKRGFFENKSTVCLEITPIGERFLNDLKIEAKRNCDIEIGELEACVDWKTKNGTQKGYPLKIGEIYTSTFYLPASRLSLGFRFSMQL